MNCSGFPHLQFFMLAYAVCIDHRDPWKVFPIGQASLPTCSRFSQTHLDSPNWNLKRRRQCAYTWAWSLILIWALPHSRNMSKEVNSLQGRHFQTRWAGWGPDAPENMEWGFLSWILRCSLHYDCKTMGCFNDSFMESFIYSTKLIKPLIDTEVTEEGKTGRTLAIF